MKQEKVYICSPYRARTKKEVKENVANAVQYCKDAIAQGFEPVCPHIYFTQFLNDNIPAEREMGLAFGIAQLKKCNELWVYGEPTSGMQAELKQAYISGIEAIKKEGLKKCK